MEEFCCIRFVGSSLNGLNVGPRQSRAGLKGDDYLPRRAGLHTLLQTAYRVNVSRTRFNRVLLLQVRLQV